MSVSSSGTNQAKGGLKLGIDEVLGITFGAIFGLVAIILCVIFTCACYVCLKRRKKMWKITQVWYTVYVEWSSNTLTYCEKCESPKQKMTFNLIQRI